MHRRCSTLRSFPRKRESSSLALGPAFAGTSGSRILSSVERLVIPPDAPLAERNAPLRCEIGRDARTLCHAVVQRDHARDLLLEALHAFRKTIAQAGDDLEQAEIDIAELAAEQEIAAAAR